MRKLILTAVVFGAICASAQTLGGKITQGGKITFGGGASAGAITITQALTDSGNSLNSPYTLAVSTTVPVGSWLVVFIATRNNADTAGTLKDSQGNCSNAYTERTGGVSWFNAVSGATLWECHITTQLTAADHLTYTPTTDFSFTWQGIAIAGLTTGFDNAPTPTSNIAGSASETVPTYTPGHANEAVCYAISTGIGALPTVTYNNLIASAPTFTDSTGLINGGMGSMGCRVVNSVTAGNGSVTLSAASNGWIGTIWGYF